MQTVSASMVSADVATQAELDAASLPSNASLDGRITAVEATSPSQKLTASVAQATTSGTAKDFTVPAWAKRITILFNGVSTNGTSNLMVQAITGASTVVATGYLGSCNGPFNASPQGAAYSTGFRMTNIAAATDVIYGHMVLAVIPGSNTWVESHNLGYSSSATVTIGGGNIVLGAALTGLRLTATNGTDAFDAGSVSILYE